MRKKTEGGFTLLEMTISAVILAILAAYAIPKLATGKDKADATAESLAIAALEMRHKASLLDYYRTGERPTVGNIVGYRAPSISEPAPAEAEVLFDYGFFGHFEFNHPNGQAKIILGYVAGTTPVDALSGNDTTTWKNPTRTSFPSCSDLTDGFWIYNVGPNGAYDAIKFNQWGSTVYSGLFRLGAGVLGPRSENINLTPIGGGNRGVPRSARPGCLVSASALNWWRNTPAAGYTEHVLQPEDTGGSSQGTFRYVSETPIIQGRLLDIRGTTAGSVRSLTRISPSHFRLTCEAYSTRYGVPYSLSGLPSLHALATGRNDVTKLRPIVFTTNTGLSGVYHYDGTATVASETFTPPGVGSAKCVRQGPAPETPPTDPGSPGDYPPAADGSGWCLSAGRKLPTYSDSAGTPTSSTDDSVFELAAEAVDDPTNCP